MTHRRLVCLAASWLLFASPPLLFAAVDWRDEAASETGVSAAVRDAALEYGKSLDPELTQVVYEGTIERFPYGHRQPTLVCAPLRICEIVLEPGEVVLDVLSGDVQHWQTFELSAGPGGSTPVVGVRPMVDFSLGDTCDKTTNLVVTTDRRIYDVLLVLPPCSGSDASEPNPQRPYHRQLSFYYPDDLLRHWTTRAELRELREAALAERAAAPQPPRLAAASGVEGLNWSYRVRSERGKGPFKRRPRFPWRPRAVFDDGERTYIRLPPEARDLPAVFAVAGGEDRILNFTPSAGDASLLIIPSVAEHLVLVLPRGDRSARLHLVNEAPR